MKQIYVTCSSEIQWVKYQHFLKEKFRCYFRSNCKNEYTLFINNKNSFVNKCLSKPTIAYIIRFSFISNISKNNTAKLLVATQAPKLYAGL